MISTDRYAMFPAGERPTETAFEIINGHTHRMGHLGHIPNSRRSLTLALATALLSIMIALPGCSWWQEQQVRRTMDRAEEHLADDDLDAALAEFEKAVELDPELAPAHSSIGRIQMLKGNLTEAGKAFTSALRLNPESYTDAFSLGEVYQKLRQFVEAVKAYRYALRLNPDDPKAHLNLGLCYHQVGELSDAIKAYERSLELDPDANTARINLGAAYDTRGDYYKAIHAYYEALERDPHQPMVLVNLATTLIKQERFGTAREALKKAIEIDPALGVAYERIGYCCFRQRDYEEAFKHYEWAATLDPKNAQPYTGMGIVCMTRHLRDPSHRELRARAIEYWHRALELNPDQTAVRKLVEKYRLPAPSPFEGLAAGSPDALNAGSDAVSSPAPPESLEPSPFRTGDQARSEADIRWTPEQWQAWIDRVRYRWSQRPPEAASSENNSAAGPTEGHTLGAMVGDTRTSVGAIPSRLANVFSKSWSEMNAETSRPTLPQALLHVMREGDREAVLFLLALNPPLDAADDDGRTPLHLAAAHGWLDVVEKLLQAQAPINARDARRQTPMHLAAENDHRRVIERLIAAGAMVNIADDEGRTPLHVAAQHGRREPAEVLAPKSLINALDRMGRSPAALARDHGHDAVVTVLRKWGGQIIPESPASDNAADREHGDPDHDGPDNPDLPSSP